jgi:hypothetical protein
MAYDAALAKVVLFGGSDLLNGSLADTWTWDGTTWTQTTAPTAPASRFSHAMAYDSAHTRVVLFGGQVNPTDGGDFLSRETWAWNGAWTEVLPAPSPQQRYGTAAVEDSTRGKIVLFGGADVQTRLLADTWTWDGTAWAVLEPLLAPPARFFQAMAYDVARGQAVLFGGLNGSSALNDTWLWDGKAWTQALPPTSPDPRSSHAMAYDAARGNVVLFSGFNSQSSAAADTWTWNGTTWTRLSPAVSPPARVGHAMAYDAARGEVVLFGGTSGLTDTWTWDGTTWTLAAPATTPPARFGHTRAYERTVKQVVLFGGQDPSVLDPFADTWTWDGTTWTEIMSAVSPRARGGQAAMAYDGTHRRVVLAGGQHEGGALDDMWLLHFSGGTCSTNDDCDTGNCVDGTCCTTASCGTCQACDIPTSPGVCAAVKSAPDPDTCSGTKACDATGVCKPSYGQPCTTTADCALGVCADGVCCDTACTGQCEACNTAMAKGTCTVVVGAPATGHPACAGATSGNVCSAATCDGQSHTSCAGFVGPSTVCGASSCSAGVVTAAGTCNGKGACSTSAMPFMAMCTPYVCAGDVCGTSCKSDADCNTMFTCNLGMKTCVSKDAASCDGMHTLMAPSGMSMDCMPYICSGTSCKTSCASVLDCVFPAECSPDGHCVGQDTGAPKPTAASGGCGCAVRARDDARARWLGCGLLFAIAAVRRRARAR